MSRFRWPTLRNIVVLLVGTGLVLLMVRQRGDNTFVSGTTMHITSSAFENDATIPSVHTCDGENVSPPLAVDGVLAEAKSLVLIVDDPDAPAGDWVHWIVWNIDPDVTNVDKDSVPAGGVEGTTDFGTTGYGGPCPPSGIHHYQHKLYALNTTLDLPTSATKKDIEAAMTGHLLEQAMLVGTYIRP